MSLNDPHWGRSSDEEKKNDRGDNEQRSDGVGEDGEEQNALSLIHISEPTRP